MENWNYNLQFTVQPEEMAGRVDGAVEQSGAIAMYTCGAINGDYATDESGVEEIITSSDDVGDAPEEDIGIRKHDLVGWYRQEDTSAEYLWCGMFALGISTSKQLGTRLTESEFWDAYRSQEMQDFNERNEFRNRNNFHDEQLARVLCIWGRRHGRDDLQLGVIPEGMPAVFIIGDDKFVMVSSKEEMEQQRDFTTVWVHNDNAQDLSGAAINHYSGVTLLGESEEPKDSSEEESSTAEDSDATMRDDAETGGEIGEESLRKALRDSRGKKEVRREKVRRGHGTTHRVDKKQRKGGVRRI